ncbi:hypothetical protein PVAP13_2NG058100 [Panicum virgatum]|uniref:Uncharacterized protein n=1 Tax=Panicum virgatum TaxID=38727 RepID=A0A8T0VCG9_PANVG|nr:hypothetical protein PVAP13_2NG058100 [Panicum virgatum]
MTANDQIMLCSFICSWVHNRDTSSVCKGNSQISLATDDSFVLFRSFLEFHGVWRPSINRNTKQTIRISDQYDLEVFVVVLLLCLRLLSRSYA